MTFKGPTIQNSACQGLSTESCEDNTVNGPDPGTGQHTGDGHGGGGEVDCHTVTLPYPMILKHVSDSIDHL